MPWLVALKTGIAKFAYLTNLPPPSPDVHSETPLFLQSYLVWLILPMLRIF